MNIQVYPLIRGIASYFLPNKIFTKPSSGGTFSSEYCYSVWLRHLHFLIEKKLFNAANEIKSVAEIGPGDSLGIGLASIYTGVNNYYAFDVIEHANILGNKKISSELVTYFVNNKEIPNTDKQINTHPKLDNYDFPASRLNFNKEFYEERATKIMKALEGNEDSDVSIKYIVPWLGNSNHQIRDLDLIISQAVMEHVSDIEFAYNEMYKWLKKGGVISHQIDFKTHEMTKEWNGHWFIGKRIWEILSHGRKYPMNRLPLSAHIKMIEKAGFTIKNIIPVNMKNHLNGQVPQVSGVLFTEDDLITSGALIQAVKH
jgi:hypothetical protein